MIDYQYDKWEGNSMRNLLPTQEKFLTYISKAMKSGDTLFFISGNSGCGKTVTIEQLTENLKFSGMLPVVLKGDSVLSDNEYLPFFNALSNTLPVNATYSYSDMIIDCGDNIPKIGKSLTTILKLFSKRSDSRNQIRDLFLNEKEHDIMCKLQYLAEHNEVVFVCENINYWDERSIKLLYLILSHIKDKYNFLSKCMFFLMFTNNKKAPNLELVNAIKNIDSISQMFFPQMAFEEFLTSLNILGYRNKLSEKEHRLIYSLVNGHIRLLVDLINELNSNRLTLETINGKSKELLSTILKQRLNEYGATGEQIKTTLEYASLLGLTFSTYELDKVMQIEKSVFRNILSHSNTMNLIEETYGKDKTLQFAHDIIHDLFEEEVFENGSDYYKKIELCLKEIEPDQYIRRYQYALKSGDTKYSIILFVLDIVKQIREDGDISQSSLMICRKLLYENSEYKSYYEFIESIERSYTLYRQEEFSAALNELLALGNIYPKEFLAEKAIMCSLCYTKKIDFYFRNKGIIHLEKYCSLEMCNYERDIYERALIRIMILYVHVGDLDKALLIEQQIIQSLESRFDHDDTAQARYHTLNRIANSLYGCEISANKMKKSVGYFGVNYKTGGLWRDIKQYYLAQINYAGAQCLNGQFEDSSNINEEVLKLFQKFPNYPFPRINILLNNYLVSGYLSNRITIHECLKSYEEIIAPLHKYADRLFYISNYSIFLALSGQLQKAIECLHKESLLQNTNEDKEQLYNYRVALNQGVYYYLLGQKEKAIELLVSLEKQLDPLNKDGDSKYDYRRVQKIITYITGSNTCESPTEWENMFLSDTHEFQSSAWNYYGKGFAFTLTFNWDI